MASKEKKLDYRDILVSMKKNIFSPFYLLMGEEEYFIDNIVKYLEEKVVPEEERDFNLHVFYGADTEISKVIATAQQFPVMSDRQLVILKEAQTMQHSKVQLDKISSYLNNPNPTTILVVTYKGDSLSATSELMKKIKSDNFILFKSDRLKDYQLPATLKDYCTQKNVLIDDKAVNLLCDYLGTSLSKVFGEIDKLILSNENGQNKIDADVIEKNIGISKDFNTFELVKAIGKKDYSRCMLIVKYFTKNPKQNPGVVIVATLFSFFSKLLLASLLRDRSDQNIMKELELKNSYAVKDYKEALRFYNPKTVLMAIHFLREFDAKSKGIGSLQNEYELLKELVFKIISYS